MKIERRTWCAIIKFCSDEPLTAEEWDDLSWISLIDRGRLAFVPGNCRWAATAAERADNLVFYKSLGGPSVH
jgi:hypothetical protein